MSVCLSAGVLASVVDIGPVQSPATRCPVSVYRLGSVGVSSRSVCPRPESRNSRDHSHRVDNITISPGNFTLGGPRHRSVKLSVQSQ